MAVQLSLYSLEDDVATVKRGVDLMNGPVILVGHSYGRFVITNAAFENPKINGLVYLAAFAPDEGQSMSDFVDSSTFPKDFFVFDDGGFFFVNQDMFHQIIIQDIDPDEAKILSAVQKPTSKSIPYAKSGPPAWKNIPSWYQISENDQVISSDLEKMFARQINVVTTLSLQSSHLSPISHPNEISQFIINATEKCPLIK